MNEHPTEEDIRNLNNGIFYISVDRSKKVKKENPVFKLSHKYGGGTGYVSRHRDPGFFAAFIQIKTQELFEDNSLWLDNSLLADCLVKFFNCKHVDKDCYKDAIEIDIYEEYNKYIKIRDDQDFYYLNASFDNEAFMAFIKPHIKNQI